MNGVKRVIAPLFILALASFLFLGAKDPTPEQLAQGIATLEQMQNAFHVVAQKVIPTVVEIRVVDVTRVPANQNPFDFFFRGDPNNAPREDRELRQVGLGSGVIIMRDGNKVYALTNNHVAGSATEIEVKLSDNRVFPAKLAGKDENKDLALVVFETKDPVPVAELGDSDTVQVGDWVLAIGNPFGFAGTITAGIVSAVGRDATLGAGGNFTDYIQTDAAINQGNSGGALVNIRGQVVGINSWIASPSGGNVGLGFSIPVNNAKNEINDLITKGKVEYGWLGINMGDVPAAFARDMNIDNRTGALVFGLFTDSPAAKAGILPGDFIYAVNKIAVKNSNQLLHIIGNLSPGKTTELALVRGGKEMTVSVTLASRGDEKTLTAQTERVWPGLSIDTLRAEMINTLKLRKDLVGVIIVALTRGGTAEKAGLQQGDAITAIDNNKLNKAADFYQFLNAAGSKEMNLRIQRGTGEFIIIFRK
jgi:Do/DeqQ family serine protease